jgi:hypothetical protein
MPAAAAAIPSPEPLSGLTLEQYAGITAALADEHALDAALGNEGLTADDWPAADAAWKERLAGDGAEGPLFAAFRARRGEAEDWIGRGVKPLDDDLGGWLAFLQAFARHAAPFELLAGAGLRLSDVARLTRRWARRMDADEALRKKAAELVKKGPGPMPAVTVGTSELKPFPWSKAKAGKAPVAPAAPLPAAAGEDVMTLAAWAEITAELGEPGADRERVMARRGLTARHLPAITSAWQERLASSLILDQDFRRLTAHHRARLRGSRGNPELPVSRPGPRLAEALPMDLPPAARLRLAGTSLLLDAGVPRGPALPFQDGAAPPEIAEGNAEASVPVPRNLGGTALALDAPVGPATPFAAAEAAAPPQAKKLAGTALALDGPIAPALPFVEGEAPPEVAVAAAPAAVPAAPSPPKNLAGTALALDAPRGPALPFAPDPPPGPPPPARPAPGVEPPALAAPSLPPLPVVPRSALLAATALLLPEPAAASAPPAPPLTLEQHASLCVELAAAPGRTAEILQRYRVTAAQKEQTEAALREAFARDPAQREAWNRAYATYRDWLTAPPR